MRRTRVLLHAIATLLPVLLFAVSMIVFVTQLFAGNVSFVSLGLVIISIVWIASGFWRSASIPPSTRRVGEDS